MTETPSTYLPSKQRYAILDGLRGVAAMIVVMFHLFETYSKGPAFQIVNHGYLAVDFFFVLSGFVIGYAYDDRWNRMSLKDFIKRRLVRLHPMVVMGTLIGALLFFLGDCPAFAGIAATPWWKLLIVTVLGALLIPTKGSLDIRGWNESYSLNGPAWTLMWEYVGNFLYATIVRHFNKLALGILVGASAFLTLNLTLNWDVFGLFTERTAAAYTVIGGWNLDPDQILIAVTRLFYPFFAGLLLSRVNKLITLKGGFWWCSLLIAVILVMPRPGGPLTNGIYEAFCIIVMFPLIVSIGAGSKIQGKKSAAVCEFLGGVSFPLYITHYPLIYLQINWASSHQGAPLGTHIIVGVSIFILAVLIAVASYKLYDIPLRAKLKEKFLLR